MSRRITFLVSQMAVALLISCSLVSPAQAAGNADSGAKTDNICEYVPWWPGC